MALRLADYGEAGIEMPLVRDFAVGERIVDFGQCADPRILA